MVTTTRATMQQTLTKRITGAVVTLGASAALALGIASPAHAAGVHEQSTAATLSSRAAASATMTPTAATSAAATPTGAALAAAGQAGGSAAPSATSLMPNGAPTAHQTTFTPTSTQLGNAKAIVKAAQELQLPPRAAVIAVATAMQESKLINLGNLGAHNDHDSLGLFQQRTSTGGWGTAAQITDPDHAAKAFLTRLAEIPGWQRLPLTEAAQKVQVSAYPSAYAKWESAAAAVVAETYATA